MVVSNAILTMKTGRFSIGRAMVYSLILISGPFAGKLFAPIIPPPALQPPLMTLLTFSNLTVGVAYQLQHTYAWYWTNLPVSFTATNPVYTQVVTGGVQSVEYRLAQIPVPVQAFAVAQVFDGSVAWATVTDGGSGYLAAPSVAIVRGGGTNATAMASISGSGAVTDIIVTSGGIGYSNSPIVKIAQPPAVAITPWTQLFMHFTVPPSQLGWVLQFTPKLDAPWLNRGPITNVQTDVFITNDVGFFRLMHP